MGSIPGERTGDGRFDGETFLGGLLMLFLGGRGRGRGAPGCVLLRSFRRTAGCKQPFLFYILYVAQWWFRCNLQGHRERGFLDPRTPWADASDVSGFNSPSTCSHSEDSGGSATLVPPRTPRSSGYDVYAHAVYVVIVVICYMSLTG
jgi:hypothetical protein